MGSRVTILRGFRPWVLFVAMAMVTLSLVSSLGAQTAELVEEENIRAEPNGALLGTLQAGVQLPVVAQDDEWVQVALEGWVWTASLQVRQDPELNLVVSETGGENLREEPQGTVLGRLEQGTFLREEERIPGWIRIRRDVWLWSPSLELTGAEEPVEEVGPPEEDSPSVEAAPAPPEGGAEEFPAVDEWVRAPSGALPLYLQPDGDSVARVHPEVQLRVLDREGNWGRVQLEGWIWLPDVDTEATEGGGVIRDVSPDEIPSDPDRFQGRLVELGLQFISLERAERVRTEFYEGEPFLLTRAEDGSRIFVYLAVPPDRLEEVEGLTPLESLRVVARVRAPASALTGSPVLDLLEIQRRR